MMTTETRSEDTGTLETSHAGIVSTGRGKAFLRQLASEPFVWFALLGAGFFLAYGLLAKEDSEIVITPGITRVLYADSAILYGREPDEAMKQRLVDQYVEDEILFREALHRGLHLSDGKVRLRLIDLVRLMLGGQPPDPSEAELATYYAEHIDNYRVRPSMTVEVTKVTAGDAPTAPERYNQASDEMLTQIFGPALVAALPGLPQGEWTKAIETPVGQVRARIVERHEGGMLSYQTVRDTVQSDWLNSNSSQTIKEIVAKLRLNYRVTIVEDKP